MRKLIVICLAFIVLSCAKESDPQVTLSPELILLEELKAYPQLDQFRAAMEACDIEMGDAQQSLTILAPSNEELSSFLTEMDVADFPALKTCMGKKHYQAWLAAHFLPGAAKIENLHTSYIPSLAQNNGTNAIHHHLMREKSLVEINGQRLSFKVKDLAIQKGYLHLIDNNLRPATIYKLIASNDQRFTTLQRAMQGPAKSIASLLNSDGKHYTFFAPDDQAFDEFFQSQACADLTEFVEKKGAKALVDLLKAHIIPQPYQLQELDGLTIESLLSGSHIRFQLDRGNIELNRYSATAMGPFPSATVESGNINAFNGSLHILNEVLKVP